MDGLFGSESACPGLPVRVLLSEPSNPSLPVRVFLSESSGPSLTVRVWNDPRLSDLTPRSGRVAGDSDRTTRFQEYSFASRAPRWPRDGAAGASAGGMRTQAQA